MRGGKHRIVTSFDWFVVVVILGYLTVVVQGMLEHGTHSLPFTPSSQLRNDGDLPPMELPEDAAVSLVGSATPVP